MRRRDLLELMVAGVGLSTSLPAGATPARVPAKHIGSSWSPEANYANNRSPLLPTKYVKLPLGASQPMGWLRRQLEVQAAGLTSHLPEKWNIIAVSAWKGETGKNVLPECCTARFVPRWLEGATALAGVLESDRLKGLADPYMQYLLTVKDPASVSPSVVAWCHLGRSLPEYYEMTGDGRAITLARTILDYADSVRESKDKAVVAPLRLGMLLSFGWWYYNHAGDHDIPALIERCTNACVEDWAAYFVHFPEDPKYFVHFPDVTAQKSPHEPPSKWTRHGVDVTQAIQYPILYYLMSKDESLKSSVTEGMANLAKAYGQVGGRWNADEWLANTEPTQGTELCDLEELLYSLEKDFEAVGEVSFADRMEKLMFNAFPGTCTADMWAHQYDQQANQVLVSVAKRPWIGGNSDTSNIYGFQPNFPCCLSNMHSPWPRYVEYMWMATADNGLVAAVYGPGRVTAQIADGATVEIVEETTYPFSDRVHFTIRTKQSVSFPIHFRIPSWANDAELSISGEPTLKHPTKGTMFKVERVWKSGDVVKLNFNFKLRTETRRNNAVAVAWGPLYFVLRIGEAYQKLPEIPLTRHHSPVPAPPGCVDWRIAATTDWNYALLIDRDNPHLVMATNPISSMPFAKKGEHVKVPGAEEYTPWPQDVPIVLKANARPVPEWGMDGGNAAAVPVSPVKTSFPETQVELIPYGCSRLRISEFPTVAKT